MKISYRTNPIIERIEKSNIGKLRFNDNGNIVYLEPDEKIKKDWIKYCPQFKSNIRVLTTPFDEAIKACDGKINNIEMFRALQSQSGVLIQPHYTTCYSITKLGLDKYRTQVFEFYKDMMIYNFLFEGDLMDRKAVGAEFYVMENPIGQQLIEERLAYLHLALTFIKYAPIEIKEVGASKRFKDVHCKYANDTRSNIQILDSTWFTTLVKSEGFKVRGHFRLQPCGKGMKDRKLIWINDFEKEGYTRHFKRPVNIDE